MNSPQWCLSAIGGMITWLFGTKTNLVIHVCVNLWQYMCNFKSVKCVWERKCVWMWYKLSFYKRSWKHKCIVLNLCCLFWKNGMLQYKTYGQCHCLWCMNLWNSLHDSNLSNFPAIYITVCIVIIRWHSHNVDTATLPTFLSWQIQINIVWGMRCSCSGDPHFE